MLRNNRMKETQVGRTGSGITRRSRCLLPRVLLIAITVAVFAGFAAARKKPKRETPAEILAGRVNNLIRRLYGLHLDQSAELTGRIQKLVVGHLDEWIAGRAPNFVAVREELESMFSQVRYPLSADVAVFQAPWHGDRLIFAGYTIGWSEVDQVSTVVVYESHGGHTRRMALTEFLPRTDVHYDPVPPDANGDFRIIVWGNRKGLDHLRLSAVLYSFDGKSLKPLWKEENYYDGRLQVSGDDVVIKYLNQNEYVRAMQQKTLPPRHEAIYTLTEKGLQLKTIKDVPF